MVFFKFNSVIVLFLFGLTLTSLLLSFGVNFDIPMLVVSYIQILSVFFVIISQKQMLSPIVFFSVLFSAYGFSGIYFSIESNVDNAIYYEMTNLGFDLDSMKLSQILVLIAYWSSVFGFYLGDKLPIIRQAKTYFVSDFQHKGINYLLYLMLTIGILYWLALSFIIAGGPVDLLKKIGVFHALLSKYITTFPYLLAVGAIVIIYCRDLFLRDGPTWLTVAFIAVVFLMQLSKGRLSGAVFFLLTFPLIYICYHSVVIKTKHVFVFCLFFCFLLFLYIFRFYSNLSYVGLESDENLFSLLGRLFFGRTNVGDLQSLSFAAHYSIERGLLAGVSFFDFSRYWINLLFPVDLASTSIGIRIKEAYFPDISGAPAPGIVSEMILNFGVYGMPLGMFFLAIILSYIGKNLRAKSDLLSIFVYCRFLIFLLILPKVDSTSIQGFFWALIPVFFLLFLVYIPKIILQLVMGRRYLNES